MKSISKQHALAAALSLLGVSLGVSAQTADTSKTLATTESATQPASNQIKKKSDLAVPAGNQIKLNSNQIKLESNQIKDAAKPAQTQTQSLRASKKSGGGQTEDDLYVGVK